MIVTPERVMDSVTFLLSAVIAFQMGRDWDDTRSALAGMAARRRARRAYRKATK